MSLFIKTLLINAGRMMINRVFIMWGLKLAAKTTDNKIDDNAIKLIDGLFTGNDKMVKESIESLAMLYKEKK